MKHGKTEIITKYGTIEYYLRKPYSIEFINAAGKTAKTVYTSTQWVATSMMKGILEHSQGWVRVNGIDVFHTIPNHINVFRTQNDNEYVTI